MRLFIFLVTFASIVRAQTPAPVAAGGGSAVVPQAVPVGDAENGRKLYVSRACFQCHNTLAQGGEGPRLAPRPIAFTAFMKELRQPRNQMPPYTTKVISDKEIADIYAYLQTIPAPPSVNTIPILNQ